MNIEKMFGIFVYLKKKTTKKEVVCIKIMTDDAGVIFKCCKHKKVGTFVYEKCYSIIHQNQCCLDECKSIINLRQNKAICCDSREDITSHDATDVDSQMRLLTELNKHKIKIIEDKKAIITLMKSAEKSINSITSTRGM